jgi:hypothetical protein
MLFLVFVQAWYFTEKATAIQIVDETNRNRLSLLRKLVAVSFEQRNVGEQIATR